MNPHNPRSTKKLIFDILDILSTVVRIIVMIGSAQKEIMNND